jgi:hypothetical protein
MASHFLVVTTTKTVARVCRIIVAPVVDHCCSVRVGNPVCTGGRPSLVITGSVSAFESLFLFETRGVEYGVQKIAKR